MSVWAVNGASFSADSARETLSKATAGARGVTLPGDLRVIALPVPGSAVRVLPGGGTLPNRYPGVKGQSYGTALDVAEDVPVPATGSGGGAVRYLIQRITDPQFEGQAPADPVNHRYDSFVWVSSITNLGYPFVELARLNQPASTATITQGMLTDLRKVANPRELPVLRFNAALNAETETLTETRTLGEWFPNAGGEQQIFIPEWATRMQVRADWAQVKYLAGDAYGFMWVEYGPGVGGFGGYQDRQYKTQNFAWDTSGSNNNQRTNWLCVDDVPIPAALRGTTQTFVMKARRHGGTANTVKIDANSGTALSVRFLEVADASSS